MEYRETIMTNRISNVTNMKVYLVNFILFYETVIEYQDKDLSMTWKSLLYFSQNSNEKDLSLMLYS